MPTPQDFDRLRGHPTRVLGQCRAHTTENLFFVLKISLLDGLYHL